MKPHTKIVCTVCGWRTIATNEYAGQAFYNFTREHKHYMKSKYVPGLLKQRELEVNYITCKIE